MRALCGIGAAATQTANYSILTKAYPERVPRVVGLLEGMAGCGLMLGPVIGSITFSVGGFAGPFVFLGVFFSAVILLIFPCIPSSVETIDESEKEMHDSDLTYTKMLSHR
jgi:MFS family permease